MKDSHLDHPASLVLSVAMPSVVACRCDTSVDPNCNRTGLAEGTAPSQVICAVRVCCADSVEAWAKKMLGLQSLGKPVSMLQLKQALAAPLPSKFPLPSTYRDQLLVKHPYHRAVLDQLTESCDTMSTVTSWLQTVSR